MKARRTYEMMSGLPTISRLDLFLAVEEAWRKAAALPSVLNISRHKYLKSAYDDLYYGKPPEEIYEQQTKSARQNSRS